jgi:hypothetical protein
MANPSKRDSAARKVVAVARSILTYQIGLQRAAYECSALCSDLCLMKRAYRQSSMSTSRKYRNCQKRPNVCFGIARSFGRRTYCLKQRISDLVNEFSMRAGVLLTVLPSQPLPRINECNGLVSPVIENPASPTLPGEIMDGLFTRSRRARDVAMIWVDPAFRLPLAKVAPPPNNFTSLGYA